MDFKNLKPHLQDEKRKRRQLERKYINNPISINLQMLQEQRRKVNKLVKYRKEEYYQSKIESNRGDQKALFTFTNDLMNKKKESILPTFSDPKVLANNVVNFFADKIDRIRKNFTKTLYIDPIFFYSEHQLLG